MKKTAARVLIIFFLSVSSLFPFMPGTGNSAAFFSGPDAYLANPGLKFSGMHAETYIEVLNFARLPLSTTTAAFAAAGKKWQAGGELDFTITEPLKKFNGRAAGSIHLGERVVLGLGLIFRYDRYSSVSLYMDELKTGVFAFSENIGLSIAFKENTFLSTMVEGFFTLYNQSLDARDKHPLKISLAFSTALLSGHRLFLDSRFRFIKEYESVFELTPGVDWRLNRLVNLTSSVNLINGWDSINLILGARFKLRMFNIHYAYEFSTRLANFAGRHTIGLVVNIDEFKKE